VIYSRLCRHGRERQKRERDREINIEKRKKIDMCIEGKAKRGKERERGERETK